MVAALPFIAIAASAGGALLKGVTSFSADQYQAAVARQNKATAAQYASYAAQQGSNQVDIEGLKARQELGNVRAGAAARGLGVNTGSPADEQTSQRMLGAYSQAAVLDKAKQQVFGYATEEQSYQAEAQMDQAKSYMDLGSGIISAVGDVAGGIPDLPGGTSPSLVSSAPTDLGSDFQWMQGPTNSYNFTGDLEEGAPVTFPIG